MKIVPARPDQADQFASIHCREISHGFLTRLGQPLLRAVYEEIILSKRSICLVAMDGDSVVGFACASRDTARLYRDFLRRHWLKAAIAIIPALLRPGIIQGIAAHFRYSRHRAATELPSAELLSLAVTKPARRRKIGTLLIGALAREQLAQRIDRFKVVMGSELSAADSFYRKVGFEQVGEIEIHRGRRSYVLVGDTATLSRLSRFDTESHA